jgi:hypothetical protein
MEYVIRFLIGGTIVSLFAVVGGLFRPRSFSGIFGAAPTVALATLGLAFAKGEAQKISIEGRSMIFGDIALGVYSLVASYLLTKKSWHSLTATLIAYTAWFAVALGLWAMFLMGQ